MACYAHPDDEAFGAAGVMSKYSSEGARCLIVTASRGEFGPDHRDTGNHIDLGEHRLEELANAASIVGAERPTVFGFPDGGVADNQEALKVKYFEQFKLNQPDVVLTFDKTGVTGHSDHLAVHRAVTDAFMEWGEPRSRLFYNLLPRRQFARLATRLKELGVESPFDADVIPEFDGSSVARDGADGPRAVPDEWITTEVDTSDVAPQKKRAIAAHESQMGPGNFVEAIPDPLAPIAFGYEYFQLAAGDPTGTADDLFGGGSDPG